VCSPVCAGAKTKAPFSIARVVLFKDELAPSLGVRQWQRNGQVDPAHNSEMELRLTDGSFRLSIAALDKTFVTATSHEPIYPKTCTDLVSVTGTTPIVAGSGTGAYRGIRGSFPVALTLNEVEATPCQPTPGGFRAQLITVAGSGTISF